MSCQFMKDLKETFVAGKEKGTFYFSHSEALLPFQSLLGLYEDDFELTHGIYGEEKTEKRKYRTSRIGSFAQNIGFVFFKCSNKKNKILTLHQEKVVQLEECSKEVGEVGCDWEEFKDEYKVFPLKMF